MVPAFFLIVVVAVFRVVMAWHPLAATGWGALWMPGFCPLSAAAFCGGLFLPRRWALLAPAGILALSDVAIDFHFGVSSFTLPMLVRYAALLAIAAAGWAARRRAGYGVAVGGSLAGSVFFYVVTNASCWLGSPDYPQTLAGLWQSLTVGLPGFPPSIVFFRNALVSDALYSMVCVAAALGLRLPAAPPVFHGKETIR